MEVRLPGVRTAVSSRRIYVPAARLIVRDHPHHRAIDRFAARTRNAGVIEQNNRQVRGKSVGDRRIPMIHAGTKVWHKDQRQSDLPPEPVISKTIPLASTNRVGAVTCVCSIR